jgi:hypothetical protein
MGDRINFFGKVFSDLGITDKVFEDGYTFDLPPCVEHTTDRLRSIIRQAIDGPIVIVNSEYSRASHAEHIEELIRSEFVNPKNVIWIHNGMAFPETPFINIDLPMLTAIHERNFMWDLITKGFDRPPKNQLPDGKDGMGWAYPFSYLPGSSLAPEKSFLYLYLKSHAENIYMDQIPNLESWSLIKEQIIDKSDCTQSEVTAMRDLYNAEKQDDLSPPEDWMYTWSDTRQQLAFWSKIPVARIDEQEAASYFNIIRETMPLDPVQCFSEKTFKPILFGSIFINPFIKDFDLWMKMYGIQPIPELQYITETPHKMTRLRAMLDFVNHNNMNSVSDLYNANKTIIDQNYDFVTSGDFFEFNMNRIDQYVTKV